MKWFFLIIFLFFDLLSKAQSTFFTGGNICNNSEWSLVFNDEFDGDSLDRIKWINYLPDTPDGSDQSEFCRTHGDEGQIFTDTNLEVSNGTLKLIARKQTATWYTATREHTSGLIHSVIRFMYGHFEARCKLPTGKGLMSAFWMFGGTGDGIGTEIDAFEIDGKEPNHHGMGVIKWHETEFFARHDCAVDYNYLADDFHIYTVDWDPFFVTFYVDEKEVFLVSRFYTLNGNQVTWCCVEPGVYTRLPAFPSSSHDFVDINLSLGVGANEDAPNETTLFPAYMEIDYVRLYQHDASSGNISDCVVLLYPNPTQKWMTIRKKNMHSFRILSTLGQVILESAAIKDDETIDVSNFEQGIYFVEVNSADGTFANKFIKN
jgi:beta-glucanase (GH16 family)